MYIKFFINDLFFDTYVCVRNMNKWIVKILVGFIWSFSVATTAVFNVTFQFINLLWLFDMIVLVISYLYSIGCSLVLTNAYTMIFTDLFIFMWDIQNVFGNHVFFSYRRWSITEYKAFDLPSRIRSVQVWEIFLNDQ